MLVAVIISKTSSQHHVALLLLLWRWTSEKTAGSQTLHHLMSDQQLHNHLMTSSRERKRSIISTQFSLSWADTEGPMIQFVRLFVNLNEQLRTGIEKKKKNPSLTLISRGFKYWWKCAQEEQKESKSKMFFLHVSSSGEFVFGLLIM